jgi:aminoglycoside phosphotransferase (APT) family kinase protein
VKQVQSQKLLKLLGIEDHPDSPVTSSWNGLILKRQREKGKAEQEYLATQLARLLLPAKLAVPHAWGVIGGIYYVSEKLEECFDHHNSEHIRRATDYLADLHAVSLDDAGLRAELLRCGFRHYMGKTLKYRLRQELKHVRRAFAGRGLDGPLLRYSELIAATLKRWTFDDDVVLGHGDFASDNLIIQKNEVIPIDWIDFGLCDRAYEVMNFVQSIGEDYRENALSRYTAATGTSAREIHTRGSVVRNIINAGSHARMVNLRARGSEDSASKFVLQVEMLEENF